VLSVLLSDFVELLFQIYMGSFLNLGIVTQVLLLESLIFI